MAPGARPPLAVRRAPFPALKLLQSSLKLLQSSLKLLEAPSLLIFASGARRAGAPCPAEGSHTASAAHTWSLAKPRSSLRLIFAQDGPRWPDHQIPTRPPLPMSQSVLPGLRGPQKEGGGLRDDLPTLTENDHAHRSDPTDAEVEDAYMEAEQLRLAGNPDPEQRSVLRECLNISHVLTDGAAAMVDDSFLRCFTGAPVSDLRACENSPPCTGPEPHHSRQWEWGAPDTAPRALSRPLRGPRAEGCAGRRGR
jgi:hypothetical protein